MSISPIEKDYYSCIKITRMESLIITTPTELKELITEAIKAIPYSEPIITKEVDESLLDKKQAAKMLNVSLATIDNYRRNGMIPSYRIGSAVRFKKSELLRSITG